MPIDVNNPYVRTKIMTASREELRLLLIEGCIDFLRTGRQGLRDKDWETVYKSFTDAKKIVFELINGLKDDVAPELCSNLRGLYTYVITTITEGSFQKDVAKIDEAIKLMEYERETWLMLMDRLKAEQGVEPGRAPATDATPPGPIQTTRTPPSLGTGTDGPPVGRSLSIEG